MLYLNVFTWIIIFRKDGESSSSRMIPCREMVAIPRYPKLFPQNRWETPSDLAREMFISLLEK